MRKLQIGFMAILAGVILGVAFTPIISGDNIYSQLSKFNYIFNAANQNYVEDVDSKKLMEAAIKGMLNELDVHSVYISEEQMKGVKEDFQGSFDGIGVQFQIVEDTITIVSPISGGPSDKLGIMSGDKIINIDGETAIAIDRNEIPKKLKGPKGTKVSVDIKRPMEAELLNFDIVRDKIPLNSLEVAFMVDNSDVGFISINRFSATTHKEFVEAAAKLREKGMQKMILDLRGNPGGYLQQAFLMADEFIAEGDTIVYTRGRVERMNETFIARPGGQFEDIPLIILVDAGSASASEIVSGSVQDLDRGLIMGVTSFGKGLVQRQYPVGDGSAFRLTIAKYYTPSGRCIQRPYKDKEKYRSLAGRLDLEEGLNTQHALEKYKKARKKADEAAAKANKGKKLKKDKKDKKAEINLDSIPVYYSRSGRTLLGGGGITPDYIMHYDSLSKLRRGIWGKNLFFYFVNGHMNKQGEDMRTQYKDDYAGFLKNFEISDEMFADFVKFAKSKKIKWFDSNPKFDKDMDAEKLKKAKETLVKDKAQYKKDQVLFKRILKANFAQALWDRTSFLRVHYGQDKMVIRALTLFPEAEKISKLK